MQSDIQSVQKGPSGTFVRALAPEMGGNGPSLLRRVSSFLQDLHQVHIRCMMYVEQLPAYQGVQLQEITTNNFRSN